MFVRPANSLNMVYLFVPTTLHLSPISPSATLRLVMMIRPTRGSAPLQLTILLLVLYIIHLHWTSPEAPLSPLSSPPSSSRLLSPQPLSPQPLSSPSVTSNNGPKNIVLSTDKANWSKSRNGPENVGIFVRPVYPQPKGMRIAIATMNTDETTYDHISLSNKFGTLHA